MDKKNALEHIARKIETCHGCKLNKSGKAVPGEGNPDADIMFLGEAPGRQEAATGRPFIGRSGQLLRRLIREAGLKEESVYITSPVKYLPDYGTPKTSDIEHGKTHLAKQIDIIQPKYIVLLGRVAKEAMLGKKYAASVKGHHVVKKDGRIYFLTFHPAAAIRFAKFKKVIERDFILLKKLLRESE